MKPLDTFLNSITMYKLVLYGLLAIAGVGLTFSALGWLSFSFVELAASLLVLTATCYFSNLVIGKPLKAPISPESSLITALILFLIMAPLSTFQDLVIAIATGLLAMASKYLLAIHKKHLFNPAAIALVIMGIFGSGNAFWWAGSAVLLPVVAVIGLMIVRKLHRFELALSFLGASLLTLLTSQFSSFSDLIPTLWELISSWPLLFFATVMLTEPQTTPPTKKLQILYGLLVGVLFGLQFHIGRLFSTPELALVIGNIFSYLVSPKHKVWLRLQQVKRISKDIYDFDFIKPAGFQFVPGQYMEWTLPHAHSDLRGNRRYFTIASSPTENTVKLGVKIIPTAASSYKKALLNLKPQDIVVASQVSGSFTLPTQAAQPLVCIAGGIGVTPFRSMLAYLLDTNQKRDITLFYAANHPDEFVYQDIFTQAAKKVGVTTHYCVTHAENAPPKWSGQTGYVTAEMIQKLVPDYAQRLFYLSGPDAMVRSYQAMLAKLGIKSSQIITDYFSGY